MAHCGPCCTYCTATLLGTQLKIGITVTMSLALALFLRKMTHPGAWSAWMHTRLQYGVRGISLLSPPLCQCSLNTSCRRKKISKFWVSQRQPVEYGRRTRWALARRTSLIFWCSPHPDHVQYLTWTIKLPLTPLGMFFPGQIACSCPGDGEGLNLYHRGNTGF